MFALALIICICALYSVRAEDKVTLTVWDYFVAQSKYYDNEIRLFQEKYPWIEVKRVKQVQTRYKTLVELAARSDNLPDLYFPRSSNIIDDITCGWVIPMDKWATPEWKKRFPKGSFTEGIHIFNGKIYCLPFEQPYVWHQLYINRKVFREAGLTDKNGNVLRPKTWTEYRSFAKTVTQKGRGKFWGVGIAGKPDHLFVHAYLEWARWAGAAGGDHVEPLEMDYRKGRYTFDNPAYVQVLQLLLNIKKDGSIIPNFLSIDDETMKVMFADGKIGMILGGIWNQKGWETTHPGWYDYDCVPEPAPDGKGYRAMQTVIAEPRMYLMSKNCKYPDAAWLFLDWITSFDAGARWVKGGYGISVYPAANTRENAKTEQFAQYLKICTDFLRWAPNPMARNSALAMLKLDRPTPSREEVFWGIMSGELKDVPGEMKKLNGRYNAQLESAIKKLQEQGYNVGMKDLLFPDWNPMENYGQ